MTTQDTGAGPVDHSPCAWKLRHEDGHWNTLHADALKKQHAWVQKHWRNADPLYDQDALDAALSAERERLARLAETRTGGWHSMTPAEIRAGRLDA